MDESPESYPFSGAENYLRLLLPALAALGMDVELIVLSRRQGPTMQAAFSQMREAQIRVTAILLAEGSGWFFPGARPVKRLWQLYHCLRDRRDRIIHLHLDYLGAPMTAWLAGCSKTIMTIHNDVPWFSSYWARIWLQLLGKTISRFIAVSDTVGNRFSAVSRIDLSRIARIYHGVDLGRAPTPGSGRTQYAIPGDRFVVGFVGRLVHQKNVDMLIEAARQIPEAHFVVAGEGDLRVQLEEQSRDLNNVQFLGYAVDGADLMSAFDLFCLPSRYEGLGLVLIEAMAQGVPIAASRAGAIREILGDGQYGLLFDIGDVEGLVRTIRCAMDQPGAVKDMAMRAMQFARSKLTVEEMTRQTVRVYEEVAGVPR